MFLGFHLGLRTVLGHPRNALLSMLVLAAILSPILVLWGLKNGTLITLMDDLRHDPRNLEIRLIGDHQLGNTELKIITNLPGVGFLQPTTRGLAARGWLSNGDSQNGREAVSLLPSGEGDPLLPENTHAPQLNEAIVSKRIADKLHLNVGSEALLRTQREDDRIFFTQPLKITGIIDAAQASGSQIILNPQLVEDVEAFLDGFAIERLNLNGRPISERHLRYANLRLYAQTIEAVPPLTNALEALDYPVLSRSADILKLLSIGRALDGIIAVVTLLLIFSYFAAASASILGVFDKHRRDIALLRLMGGSRMTIFCFISGFGFTTGLVGLLCALGLYSFLAQIINTWFPLNLAGSLASCELNLTQLISAVILTLILIFIVTIFSAWRFVSVSPGSALRAN